MIVKDKKIRSVVIPNGPRYADTKCVVVFDDATTLKTTLEDVYDMAYRNKMTEEELKETGLALPS